MYDVVIKFQLSIHTLFLRYCYYTILEGRGDTARFVWNLAKSKNGQGQNGQKIGQNGHRTGLARLPDYYLNIYSHGLPTNL